MLVYYKKFISRATSTHKKKP